MTPTQALDSEEDVREYELTETYQSLLKLTRYEDHYRAGLNETPGRAARAWMELTSGYAVDVEALLKTFDSDGYDEMVVVKGVPFASLCEHHLLPFTGTAAVAYIPNGRIVGLSKIPRLVDAFARRLQVQERLTTEICEAFVSHLDPVGVMVVVEAVHSCAAIRGVRKPGTAMVTSAVRGALKDKPEARAEALSLIG